MMAERWARLAVSPVHEISTHGRLRRVESCRGFPAGHVLTPFVDAKGYQRISLRAKAGSHFVSIHVAVLETFVGPRPLGCDASHINGIRDDNRLENLCWETASANHRRKLAHGTLIHGEKHKCSKLTVEQVRAIRHRKGEKVRDIGADYGVSGTLVSRIQRGIAWPHVA